MEVKKKTSNAQHREAFTLIELLVVITIIVVLMGLLFPAFRGVQDQARRTQAKNDLTQIVTAVNAFYTEYGRYPIEAAGGTPSDVTLSTDNDKVIDVLRNNLASSSNSTLVAALNPKQIAFLSVPDVKDANNPRSGIKDGKFYDPWGAPYFLGIDGEYSGLVQVATAFQYPDLTYSREQAGSAAIQTGVIAASYGADQTKGTKSPPSPNFKGSDDVVSWQ